VMNKLQAGVQTKLLNFIKKGDKINRKRNKSRKTKKNRIELIKSDHGVLRCEKIDTQEKFNIDIKKILTKKDANTVYKNIVRTLKKSPSSIKDLGNVFSIPKPVSHAKKEAKVKTITPKVKTIAPTETKPGSTFFFPKDVVSVILGYLERDDQLRSLWTSPDWIEGFIQWVGIAGTDEQLRRIMPDGHFTGIFELERYLGIKVKNAPPIPEGLIDSLNSVCPIMKGKGKAYGFPTDDPLMKDTHTVFLMPKMSVVDWDKMMDDKSYKHSPHQDGQFFKRGTKGAIFLNPKEASWAQKKPEYEWMAVPMMFLLDSVHKFHKDKLEMVPDGYEVAEAVHLVAQAFLHYIQTGKRLHGAEYKKYTTPPHGYSASNFFPTCMTKTKTVTRFFKVPYELVCIGNFDTKAESSWKSYGLTIKRINPNDLAGVVRGNDYGLGLIRRKFSSPQ